MVRIDEVRPADLTRFVVLVEERAREESTVVDVSDDQPELRRPDRAADEWRHLVIDRLADP